MITDNKINVLFLCIGDFFIGFYSAIQTYDKAYPLFGGIIYTLCRNSITFVVAIRYIVFHVLIELIEEGEYQGHTRGAINVIIAINHDALIAFKCSFYSLDGKIHVLHEKGVVKHR